MFQFLSPYMFIVTFLIDFAVLCITQVLIFCLYVLLAGGGRDPGGAGKVGASAEPAYS